MAQKFVADKNVVAIEGPSTSGAVVTTSQIFFDAGLAHVSPSATRTSLTKSVEGKAKEATPGFFRVVPDDGIQGPTDARFMIDKLKVKKVVVIDFQEPYSLGFSAQVEAYLKAKGVATSHLSIANTVTDFSSFVTKVPSDADIVFFPTQKPEDAQTFAQQLVEQGKKAKVFGGDGSNGPGKFKAAGSYVSTSPRRSVCSRTTSRSLTDGRRTTAVRSPDRSGLPVRRDSGALEQDQGSLHQGQRDVRAP